MAKHQVFISYAGRDAFEASLLQYALESMLSELGVQAWTFQRDQALAEKQIARSLKNQVRKSIALIFLVSPETLDSGATQWMELAYADAFGVTTFVLLHHLNFGDLGKSAKGVPPLLLSSQCNAASEWRVVVRDIKKIVQRIK